MSYSCKLVGLRILDRKHVTLLSTIYNTNLVDTGKKHWQTKEAIMKPSMIHNYNTYLGAVDSNDQLLKYSAFSRRTIKWWRKVIFRILNLSIVNAYIMFLEWQKAKGIKYKGTETNFRVKLIQCMIENTDQLQPPAQRRLSTNALTHQRLSGRHFIQKIPNSGQETK